MEGKLAHSELEVYWTSKWRNENWVCYKIVSQEWKCQEKGKRKDFNTMSWGKKKLTCTPNGTVIFSQDESCYSVLEHLVLSLRLRQSKMQV